MDASLLRGIKRDFGLKCSNSNATFNRIILSSVSNSFLSFSLPIKVETGTKLNLFDNKDIVELVMFHLVKLYLVIAL